MDIAKIKALHTKHSKYYPAAFFLGGFLFDIITLSRIDDPFSIIQQAVYLILIGQFLYYRQLEVAGLWQIPPKLEKLWEYQNEALHFIIGSLLSSYTLFYFVSASLSTSFIFMILIAGLLVANELPVLQKQSLPIKLAIYYLCLLSFLSYLTPIVLRFVSIITLLISVAICLLMAWTSRQRLVKKGISIKEADKLQIWPAAGVCAAILLLYFLRLLPPIPLSVQYMGVYHKVEKDADSYVLSYSRPFWKFWQNGAQSFEAQPGDKINVFARIFSPATMDDHVVFRWEQYINGSWQTSDQVQIRVVGGRDQGFRAYAVKSNFQPGEWRVKVETTDGREMGRLKFDVELSEPENRDFKIDRQ